MRRRVLTILILLLAGAVVNVTVAWGCAACSRDDRYVRPGDAKSEWVSEVVLRLPSVSANQASWGLRPAVSDGGVGVRREEALIEFVSSPSEGLPIVSRYWVLRRVRAGVPAPALEAWAAQDGRRRWTERLYWYALQQPRQRWDAVLPLRPIWPGFAVNTLFYATLLWLPICGPFVLRQFVRVRRGLCPKCGYRMGESAVCSECGAELPERVARVTTVVQ